jgi:hypothetical protein
MAIWKYFVIGLGIGILGAILWFVASAAAAAVEAASGKLPAALDAFMIGAFLVMVLAPLTFWIILPVRRAVKKHRARVTGA